MRGCSRSPVRRSLPGYVLPAHAGVLPFWPRVCSCRPGPPRACGGAPLHGHVTYIQRPSSPRMRGCSFETLAPGVCRKRPPRACGGAPQCLSPTSPALVSSPRMRGCSACRRASWKPMSVSSPLAGVFLTGKPSPRRVDGILPACGGVPTIAKLAGDGNRYPPRLRGCSLDKSLLALPVGVPSPHAGVFPWQPKSQRGFPCILPACGGVPDDHLYGGGEDGASPRRRGSTLPETRHPSRAAGAPWDSLKAVPGTHPTANAPLLQRLSHRVLLAVTPTTGNTPFLVAMSIPIGIYVECHNAHGWVPIFVLNRHCANPRQRHALSSKRTT